MTRFLLDDAEQEIQRTAERFVREHLPVTHLRALRDANDPRGHSPAVWRELGRLGFLGLAVPEAWGGAGAGFAPLGLVLEAAGRTLAPLPFLSTAVLGAGALLLGGSDAQRRAHLPALCAGERLLALAHDEGPHHHRRRVATRAVRTPGGFRLDGEKVHVLDGHVADALVVSARTAGGEADDGGLTLFLVPAGAPGLAVERRALVDSRGSAHVRLDGVTVSETDVIGRVDEAGPLLDRLLDTAAICLAAESLGGMAEVFELTLAYLKTRKQFGVPIGSFQALRHRAAALFCERELLRSVVRAALVALDEAPDQVPRLACAAKARAADAFLHAAAEAIQLHGGIGVTDELDVGLYYKRARVAEVTFGAAGFWRARFAQLSREAA